MSFEPPSLPVQEIKERKLYQEVQQSLTVFNAPPKPYWWSVS
jgi:hypothetical protein